MIHVVVPIGISHISWWPQEIQPREWEEKNKEQTNNMGLGKLKRKKGGPMTLRSLCICRLTLASISSEISKKLLGMLIYLDWSSSLLLNSISCRLVTSAVRCRLPLCVTLRQLASVGSFFQLLSRVPFPTSGRVEISSSGLCLVSRQNKQKYRLLGAPPS